MPADPVALLRSRSYLGLLAMAALLGVPVSAAAYGFLALVDYLQAEIFTHLPHGLGLASTPAWWPLPVLTVGGVLAALAIRYLPGQGGSSPAGGFAMHAAPAPAQLPGVFLAALATLVCGAVLGPEMPLIALGGGLAVLAAGMTRREVPDQGVAVLSAAGSFAAIATLLGSPILGAFLLMEASGLGGPTLGLVLVPGLLSAGVGDLMFTGMNNLTGLGTFSLAIPGLPPFSRPDVAEFGWAVVIGVAAAAAGPGISWMGRHVADWARRWTLLAVPAAGVAVAGLAIGYAQATGEPASDVLFSGQSGVGHLITHASGYTAGALALLLACKGLAYGASLGGFRGGPVFPAMFLGAAGGVLLSHLPGLPLVAGVAMGMGAMSVVMLTLPMTSVLLATLLLFSDGLAVMPLVIVAVVVAYVAVARIAPRRRPGQEREDARPAGPPQPGPPQPGQPQPGQQAARAVAAVSGWVGERVSTGRSGHMPTSATPRGAARPARARPEAATARAGPQGTGPQETGPQAGQQETGPQGTEPQGTGAGRAWQRGHDSDLTITIPLDRVADLVTGSVTEAGRVLSARGGLPLYVGLGVLAAADVIAWPVAAAAGFGYAVLRQWGPLRPAARPPRGDRPEASGPAAAAGSSS